MILFGSHTEPGLVKKVNQDSFCFMEADTSVGKMTMAIVCDGVGGFQSGEMSSSTVIQRFVTWFCSLLPRYLAINDCSSFDVNNLQGIWGTLLQQCSNDICEYSKGQGWSSGTTFTGMLICEDQYFICHVGDCRVYQISDDSCRILTHDQTLVQRLVDAGEITSEEARTHPRKNVILQAVGTKKSVSPVFQSGVIKKGDLYMICCDGARNAVQQSEIHELFAPGHIVSDEQLQARCQRLADLCKSRKEKDNITVISFGWLEGVHASCQDSGFCKGDGCMFAAINSKVEEGNSRLGQLPKDPAFNVKRCAASIHSDKVVDTSGELTSLLEMTFKKR